MKNFNKVSLITLLLIGQLLMGSATAFGPPGPGPGPGPGPMPGGPVGPMIGGEYIKDKICFMRSANRFKSCVNSCPKLDMQQTNPDIEGGICIVKCMESFSTYISRCL